MNASPLKRAEDLNRMGDGNPALKGPG